MSEEEVLAELERELAGVVTCDLEHGYGPEHPEAVGIIHLSCPDCESAWSILVCLRHSTTFMLQRALDGRVRCGECAGLISAVTHALYEDL